MAKYLKVRVRDDNGTLSLGHIDAATISYVILDKTKKSAKLTIEMEIMHEVEEIETVGVEVPPPIKGFNYLIVNENTSFRIPTRYDTNIVSYADQTKNAQFQLNFKLPGKTPGTLGNGEIDSKTPGTTEEDWFLFE